MTLRELEALKARPLTATEHGIVSGAIKRTRKGHALTDKQIAALDRIVRHGPAQAPNLPMGPSKYTTCYDCGASVEWPTGFLRHMQAEHKDIPGVRATLEKIRTDREEYDRQRAEIRSRRGN